MARYPLIIRDQTYLVLLQMAADRGQTMGKFLSVELDNLAKGNVNVAPALVKPKIEKPCYICKHESTETLENIASGMKKEFCAVCAMNALESHKWKTQSSESREK